MANVGAIIRALLRTSDDSIADLIINRIPDINRRLTAFRRAGRPNFYHVAEIERLSNMLDLETTPTGRISQTKKSKAHIRELSRTDAMELLSEMITFQESKVGDPQTLYAIDKQRIDTLWANHTELQKHDKLTVEEFRDMVDNETIQRALASKVGFSSTQLFDDYNQMLDNKKLSEAQFIERLDAYLTNTDKLRSYFDYMSGKYDKEIAEKKKEAANNGEVEDS